MTIYPDFPRVACVVFCTIAFEGINTLTSNYLETDKIHHTGIIYADFPGKLLIENIISHNNLSRMSIYSDSFMHIKLKNTNYCLDVWEGKIKDGTDVKLYQCHNGKNQKWRFDHSTYLIRNQADPTYCLAPDTTSHNSKLILKKCSRVSHLMQWVIDSSDHTFTFKNDKSFLDKDKIVLSVDGQWSGANARLSKISPDSKDKQEWNNYDFLQFGTHDVKPDAIACVNNCDDGKFIRLYKDKSSYNAKTLLDEGIPNDSISTVNILNNDIVVLLYKDDSFSFDGRKVVISGIGKHYVGDKWNDEASALKVLPKIVTVYQYEDFGGRSASFPEGWFNKEDNGWFETTMFETTSDDSSVYHKYNDKMIN